MEDRLARALGSWGAAHRIEAPERERMHTAILLTPEVDVLWWDQFNQQMARLTARAVMPFAGASLTADRAQTPRIGWGAAAERA